MMCRKHCRQILCAALLCLALVSCGISETDDTSDTEIDVATESDVGTEENTETDANRETEAETEYVQPEELTISEMENNPSYDSTTGLLTVRFDDPYVMYKEDDKCEASLSGGGAAYYLTGSIDMSAADGMKNEKGFYTGIVVHLTSDDEQIEAGEYKMILQFSGYSITARITLDAPIA